MSADLVALFVELEATPVSTNTGFQVRRVPGYESHYVGRDAGGQPCLLLRASNTGVVAPVRLANIEAHFSVPCNVAIEGEIWHETLSVVVCSAVDASAKHYFLHICETIVRMVGREPKLALVVEVVRKLVDLFRRLAEPASRPLLGLIGELFTILCSSDPRSAVHAWRSAIDDRFDFSVGNVRVEVKASGTRARVHNFSAEQCSPPAGTLALAVSLFIERTAGGLSLLEMILQIERRLDDGPLVVRLHETVASTLGQALPAAMGTRFDDELARESLRLYELASIPAVRDGIPSGVSQVRFVSDLTHAPIADASLLRQRSELLDALLPGDDAPTTYRTTTPSPMPRT